MAVTKDALEYVSSNLIDEKSVRTLRLLVVTISLCDALRKLYSYSGLQGQ